MDLGLQDKVAIVSGGAKGIGAAVVRRFAAEGARVFFIDRDRAAAETLVKDLAGAPVAPVFLEGDLSDAATCQEAIEEVMRRAGRIDALVNNAGYNDAVGLEASLKDFHDSLRLNLDHVFLLTRECQEPLKASRGAVLNVGSKVSLTGQGRTTGYAAAKGAINALTREWALALAPHGVRVNAVLPAECLTDQYERWFASLPEPARTRAAIEAMIPLEGRMTRPEEVADMIVFLSSSRASHTTGEIILVDGGYTRLDRAFGRDHTKWG